MVIHYWGDKDVDWNGIDDAAHIIGKICTRYGRMMCHTKEKYATVRAYTTFGYLCLHGLIYPGYVGNQFPKWLWHLDCKYIGPFLQKFFTRPFVWWQVKVYQYAYKTALKKYPHLREEILCCADYHELLKDL